MHQTRIPFLLTLLLLIAVPLSAQNTADESLGVIKPTPMYERSVIAVPQFGKDDSAPVEFGTLARIVRRDLELTGLFELVQDQRAVNNLNLVDVRNQTVQFDKWNEMGAEFYLMANISQPEPGVLRSYTLLYEIPSRKRIISRNIDGSPQDVRALAHKITDEVVRYTKFMDGFAQSRVLFINEQIPGVKEVCMMDSDGFNLRPLTSFGNICTTPSWGANGTEVYYTSYHGNRANIYGQQLGSNSRWTIAAYGGTNHSPDWNQANKRLVMVLSKDGGSELYSCKRDGTDLQRLTRTKANEGSPCWSPDGSKIAFASDEGNGVQLYVMNADGTARRRLTPKGTWNDAPAWSPDGSRIAFVSRINQVNDIYVIDADGSPDSLRRLTMDQGDNESPAWAPNSRHLAFSSDRSGRWQVYLMLDDGSNQTALTTTGRNTQPAWSPIPQSD